MTERRTTDDLAAFLAGTWAAGLPVPRESSTLEVKAAFLLWQNALVKDDYQGISGMGVYPFDLPEVGSTLMIEGQAFTVLTSRWDRESEGDRVQYNLIVRKGQESNGVTVKYGASVRFTDPDVPEIYVEEDGPDKARITALQKAKLTGHEPRDVHWATDDGDQIMLWPSQERMSVQAYNEKFPDDVRYRDPETL